MCVECTQLQFNFAQNLDIYVTDSTEIAINATK